MIVDDPRSHFIFLYHPGVYSGVSYTTYRGRPLTNGEAMEHWGKWLVLGPRERLDQLAEKLDVYVETGEIPCVKYDREPSKNLGMDDCVLMVYCDERNRDEVFAILRKHGVKLKAWVFERETLALWRAGAPLLEQYMESRGLPQETRETIRTQAEDKAASILENPDAVFSPWEQ